MTAGTDTREADWIKYQNNIQAIQQLQNENIVLVSRIKEWIPPAPEPVIIQAPAPAPVEASNEDGEELVGTREASKILHISVGTVQSLVSQEILQGYRLGHKLMIKRKELQKYLKGQVIRKDTAYQRAMAR